MQHYAIHRTNAEDELTHWKYIKKIKVNGKWKYIYDRRELDKFKYGDKEITTKRDIDERINDATITKTTTVYKKSKSLFDKKTSSKEYSGYKKGLDHDYNIFNKKVEYRQGKLSRVQAKAEKWIFNTFFKQKKKTKSSDGKIIEKAKKFVGDLLGKTVKKSEKPNYIAKVKTPNGRTRYFYSQDEYNTYLKRLEYQKNEPDFLKHVKKIDKNKLMSADEDMEITNPKYSSGTIDYTTNCFKCVMTYELRRRGYDVEANKANPEEQHVLDTATMFKNAKIYSVKDDGNVEDLVKKEKDKKKLLNRIKRIFEPVGKYDRVDPDPSLIESAIKKHSPKNSRGIITVNWNRGGAHAMTYEVNSNGKIIIRDPQVNDIYTIEDISSRGYNITFARLDNLEMKKRVLKNVK